MTHSLIMFITIPHIEVVLLLLPVPEVPRSMRETMQKDQGWRTGCHSCQHFYVHVPQGKQKETNIDGNHFLKLTL